MTNRFVAISLSALVALSPLPAMAQSEAPAQPVQVAQASTTAAPTAPRGLKASVRLSGFIVRPAQAEARGPSAIP